MHILPRHREQFIADAIGIWLAFPSTISELINRKQSPVKRIFLFVLLFPVLAGCAPQGKTGQITLVSPPDGAIIYSSTLTISGEAKGLNSGGFVITVTGTDGSILTRKVAPERDAEFEYELLHGYTGEPTAAILSLTAADAPDDPPYVSVNLTLASLEHRPEGSYVDILTPSLGDEIGGDVILVQGRASGLATPTFTVELVGSDSIVVDAVEVVLPPGYVADDLPWNVALSPGTTTGSAIIRVVDSDGAQLSVVPVVLSSAAG